jgi:uncharacterized protein (DUF58 family)
MTATIEGTAAPETESDSAPQQRYGVAPQSRAVAASARSLVERADTAVRRGRKWLSTLIGPITPLGRSVLVLAVVAWLVGWQLGWYEFMIIASAGLLALLAAVPFLIGRSTVAVAVDVVPERVTVGEKATGRVRASSGARRSLPLRLELPAGAAVAEFDLPSIAAGGEHEELFRVPTRRRAVITLGPASTVRSDPLALIRRETPLGEPVELIVHPAISRLETLGSGFLRDLEGQSTNHLSSSDIAFHTLRDYVPGDDRRFVHWRTSARTGRLMVRQFVDTRKSHAAVVLDVDPASFEGVGGDPAMDEFELAVSIAASLAVRVLRDEQELTLIAGSALQAGGSGRQAMDSLARVEPVLGHHLATSSGPLARAGADASIAFLITGSRGTVGQMRQALRGLSADVRVLGFRTRLGAPGGFRDTAGLTLADLGALEQLPSILRAVTR